MSKLPPKSRRSPPLVTDARAERGPPAPATLHTLSPAGLCCRTATPMRELAKVQVALLLESAAPMAPAQASPVDRIEVTGVVVDCQPVAAPATGAPSEGEFEVALIFPELPARGRERLCARVAAIQAVRPETTRPIEPRSLWMATSRRSAARN